MKPFITFAIFGMLFLSGCGEDGSFSVGGVSLGGTGTGVPIGGSNTNPPIPGDPGENGPILIQPDHFELVYPSPQYPQNCDGIERVYQFIDKASGRVILEGSRSALSSMKSQDLTNVILRLRVKNTSSKMVYEYIDACKTPIKIIDTFNGENKELKTNQRFSCDVGEYIQTYQTNEEKVYNLDFDLPNHPTIWQFNYQPTYSFGLLAEKTLRTECPVLSTTLAIEAVEKSAPPAKLYLDNGIVVILPPPLPPVIPTQPPIVVESPTQPPVVVEPPAQPPVVVEPPAQPPVVVEPPAQLPVVVEPPTQPPVVVEPPVKPPVVVEPPVNPPILVEPPIQPPLVLMQVPQRVSGTIQLVSPTLRAFMQK